MQITVNKLDDINIRFSGTIENTLIESRRIHIQEEAIETLKNDKTMEASEVESKLAKLTDEAFQKDAEGELLQEFMDTAIKQANLHTQDLLGQPDFKKYEKKEDAIYIEVEISTIPHIDTNVTYTDIVPSYTKPIAEQKVVDAQLVTLSVQHAPYSKIEDDRAVKNGDLVVIDFKGYLNGRLLEAANEEGYKLKIGSHTLMGGFEEQMIGMKTGEEKVLKITFPTSYQAKELAGKQTDFNVTLHEINEQVALEIDDALAIKILKNDAATLDLLRKKLTKQIEFDLFSNLYNATLKPQIIKGLLTKFDFTLPNNVVEQEIDAKVNVKAQQMTKEERTRYQEDKSKFQALRTSLREEAKNAVKAALIVDALAKKEGIVVEVSEAVATLKQQAKATNQDPEELVEYYQENNLMTSVIVGLIEDKLFTQMLGLK